MAVVIIYRRVRLIDYCSLVTMCGIITINNMNKRAFTICYSKSIYCIGFWSYQNSNLWFRTALIMDSISSLTGMVEGRQFIFHSISIYSRHPPPPPIPSGPPFTTVDRRFSASPESGGNGGRLETVYNLF